MKTKVLYGIACAISLVPFRPAMAQPPADTTRLDDLTVTATRVPIPRAAVTASVTVLDGESLRAQGITTVAEALRTVPGVSLVQNGSFGAATSLFLRGGESDYVQVLIDGVTVNQPGGAFNLAHLTVDNVERIEILRGPGSVLYGSDATAGVIQIVTSRGRGATSVQAGARAGTFGSVGGDVAVRGASGRAEYTFALSRFATDGAYAFNNDYDNTTLSGRVGIRPDARTELGLTLRYHDSEFHFPTDGSGNLVDENARNLDETTTVGIEIGRFLTDRIEARMLIASNVATGGTDDAQDHAADTLGFFAFRSLQDLSRQSVDARVNAYVAEGVVLSAGAQVEQQEERSFNESESAFGPSNSSSSAERSNRAYYGQVLLGRAGWSGVVGGRIDDNETFGRFGTFRVGAAYRLPSATKLRASVGRSFKAPTFFQNYATGFVTGNPDLQPERSVAWEIGARQEGWRGRLAVEATYFAQRYTDLIQFTADATPNYVNVAEADASGVEIEAEARPAAGVVLSATYTRLDTEVIDAGFDAGAGATFVLGQRLLRRPTETVAASVWYDGWERGGAGVTVHHVGDRDDRDFATFPATPVVLEAYTTADVSGRLRVTLPRGSVPGITGTLRVENVFDRVYQTAFGFPARGRTVFVGGRIGT